MGRPVVLADGTVEYRKDGVLHRADGPAVIRPDGSCEFRTLGRLHRVDGPAVIAADASAAWWVDNKQIPDVDGKLLHLWEGGALDVVSKALTLHAYLGVPMPEAIAWATGDGHPKI